MGARYNRFFFALESRESLCLVRVCTGLALVMKLTHFYGLWRMDRLKVTLPYHMDGMKQAAGLAALEFGDEMDARVAQVIDERERLLTAFEGLPVTTWPSAASFELRASSSCALTSRSLVSTSSRRWRCDSSSAA